MKREEAVKIVKENMHLSYDDGNTFEALKTLIPELRDSEDERIREEMLNSLKEAEDSIVLTPFKKKRWIAYLEKQKEQKPAECIPDFVKFDEGFKTGRELGFREGVESVKSAEWSEEDKDYYDAIIAKLEVTQDDALLTDNQIDYLKSLPERFNLQPNQEQPEVDLEKEVKRWKKKHGVVGMDELWLDFARHFWNKGYNARKEE